MFNSAFSRRLFRWATGKKRFVVNVDVFVDGKMAGCLTLDVQARYRYDAHVMASELAKNLVTVKVAGSKSLGPRL